MNILKTASAAIISALVVSTAPISARAAMTGFGSIHADVVSASNPDPAPSAEHNWLMPSEANRRSQSATCKPGRIFSQHDVVGDPESCIMQDSGYSLAGGGAVFAPF